MLKNGVIWLAIISALVPAIQSAHAQDTRLYQIISGRYTACCGIAGPFIEPLPNPSQEFIELTLDTQRNLAQMKFLAQDMHTVLSIPAEGPRSGFTYAFSNGMILPDFIRFEEPFPPPVPTQPYFSYTVTNLSDTLWINGTLIAPCLGCADIPEEFQHTNLVAILLPAATI